MFWTNVFNSLMIVNLCGLISGDIVNLPTTTTMPSALPSVFTPSPTSGIVHLPQPPPASPKPTPTPPISQAIVSAQSTIQQQLQSTGSDLNPSESKSKRSYGPIKGYNDNDNQYREISNDLIEEDYLVKHEANLADLDKHLKGGRVDKGKSGLAAHDYGKHDLNEAAGIAHLDQKIHKDHDKYIKHTWNRGDGFVKRWSWDQGAHFEKEKDEGDKKHIEHHGKKVHQEHHQVDKAAAKENAKHKDAHKSAYDSGSAHHSGDHRDSGFVLEDYNYKDNHRSQQGDKRKLKEKQPKKYKDYHYNDDHYPSPYDFVNENFKMAKTGSPSSPPPSDRKRGYRSSKHPRRRPEGSAPPPPPPPPPPPSQLEDNYKKNFDNVDHSENGEDDEYNDDDDGHQHHSSPVNPHEGTDSFYFSQSNDGNDEMPANFGYISSKPREDKPFIRTEHRQPHTSSRPSSNSPRDSSSYDNRSPSKSFKNRHTKEISDNWKSISRQDQKSGSKNNKRKPYRHERIVKYIDEYDNDLHPDMEPPKSPKYTDYPYPAEDEKSESNHNINGDNHYDDINGKPRGRKTVHHHHERRQYYVDDSQRSPITHQEESRNHLLVHGNHTDGSSLLNELTPQQFQTVLDNEFSRTGHLGMGHLFGYSSEIPPVVKFMSVKK